MPILLGLLLVLTGAFLAIIGSLGAIGSGLTLRLLPGRKVSEIGGLSAESGRVVVRGTVAAGPGGTYQAPLSGQDCVWYLASQTATDGTERRTVDRFPPEPFELCDAQGRRVLVGPRCPGLEQVAPSARETRAEPHPWFDEAPGVAGEIEVFEFVLTSGTDLLAAGDLDTATDGTPTLGGDVTLSAAGDDAAAGDPARRSLRRDLALAGAGAALIAVGSLILGVVDQSACDAGQNVCAAGEPCRPC